MERAKKLSLHPYGIDHGFSHIFQVSNLTKKNKTGLWGPSPDRGSSIQPGPWEDPSKMAMLMIVNGTFLTNHCVNDC